MQPSGACLVFTVVSLEILVLFHLLKDLVTNGFQFGAYKPLARGIAARAASVGGKEPIQQFEIQQTIPHGMVGTIRQRRHKGTRPWFLFLVDVF